MSLRPSSSRGPLKPLRFKASRTTSREKAHIILIDDQHQVTEDPIDVFSLQREKLAKCVPVRPFKVERTERETIVHIMSGIRIYVFCEIISHDRNAQFIDEKTYYDHVHHIARQVAQELNANTRQHLRVYRNVKQERNHPLLGEEMTEFVDAVRDILCRIALIGTTNLCLSTGGEAVNQSFSRSSESWFDDSDLPSEMVASCRAESLEEPSSFRVPHRKVEMAGWGKGTVADYLPKMTDQEAQLIQDIVNKKIVQYFEGRI